jgi:oligopeptide/dipeptide ABC transporter ATP-binding protein
MTSVLAIRLAGRLGKALVTLIGVAVVAFCTLRILPGAAVPLATGPRQQLGQIAGTPPDPGQLPDGCSFAPRCRQAVAACADQDPALTDRDNGSAAACLVPPAEWRP